MFETKFVFGGNDNGRHRNIWDVAADFNKESKGMVFNAHGNYARLNEKPESIRTKHSKRKNLNIRRVKVESYTRVGVL